MITEKYRTYFKSLAAQPDAGWFPNSPEHLVALFTAEKRNRSTRCLRNVSDKKRNQRYSTEKITFAGHAFERKKNNRMRYSLGGRANTVRKERKNIMCSRSKLNWLLRTTHASPATSDVASLFTFTEHADLLPLFVITLWTLYVSSVSSLTLDPQRTKSHYFTITL